MRSAPIRYRAALASALLFASGCAMERDDVGELASDESEITGGTLVTSNAAPFSSVVRISSVGGGCTATKIDDRRFITAAHCVDGVTAGGTILLTNALNGTFWAADTQTVDAVHVHPTYSNDPDNASSFDPSRAYDVAVIDIVASTPGIPELGVRGSYVAAGAGGTAVGYGCDDAEGSTNGGRKQQAAFTAMSLADYKDRSGEADEMALSRYTYNIPFEDGGDTQLCPGDSGGPLLVQNADDQWLVAGVNSAGWRTFSYQARVAGASLWSIASHVNMFLAGSRGFLLNGKSNLCVGVAGGSSEPDANAGQYYCDGRHRNADNQNWELVAHGDGSHVRLRNGKSGLCLGVASGSTAHGARIAQYACGANNGALDNQTWRFEQQSTGKFRIVNGKSGRCIGVSGASTDRNAQVMQFTCDGFANQGWIFTR